MAEQIEKQNEDKLVSKRIDDLLRNQETLWHLARDLLTKSVDEEEVIMLELFFPVRDEVTFRIKLLNGQQVSIPLSDLDRHEVYRIRQMIRNLCWDFVKRILSDRIEKCSTDMHRVIQDEVEQRQTHNP